MINKKIFIVMLSLVLIASLGIISANELNNTDKITTEKITDQTQNINTNLEKTGTKQVTQTISKNITKNQEKNTKQATSVEVNNYDELIKEVNLAKTSNAQEYVINLRKGDYNATGNMTWNHANGKTRVLTINGNNITLDGQGEHILFKIGSPNTINLKNIIIKNYYSKFNGGAIYNNGTLTITGSTINNNKAKYGGAVYNDYGKISIFYSTLNNNTVQEDGGAISNWKGNITLINTTLNNNNAEFVGGAIDNVDGTLTITGSTINNNKAETNGGAINNEDGRITITNTTLNNNTAEDYGGAIYNGDGNITITQSKLNNNTADEGGAIYNTKFLEVYDSSFMNNSDETIYSYKEYKEYIFINSTINNKTSTIKELEEKIKNLTHTIWELQNKNEQLENENNNLNKTVAARDATIKELTTKTGTKITATKINTTQYASTLTVTGKVTDKTGKALNNMPVIIKINTSSTKVVTNANGVYKYTTIAWRMGTNNVTVSTIANDKYTTSSAKTTFKVSKAKPVLKLNSISAVKYKDKVTVTGSLMNNANKAINGASITLKINTKTVTVKTGKDGSFTYSTTASSMGTNNVTATYNGNTKYTKVSGKTTFKVNKQTLLLTVDRVASGLKFKEPLVVSGRLVNGNNKAVANTLVSLQFNGKTYKAKTDKNGYYKITTRATTIGKNTLTVSNAGNTKYNKATAKTTFTVAKQDIIIGFNSITYSNGKVTIKGTFTDRNRHALINTLARITINGKQATAKTDKTGTFTYTTPAGKGTYKVTLAYPGNAQYNAYSKTSTVKTA